MKVAFISQPIEDVVTGDDSVNLITREHAPRVARECDVVVFGAGRGRIEEVDGVRYRCIPLDRDRHFGGSFAGKVTRKLHTPRRPPLSSRLWAPFFWREIASQLESEKPDIVHVHNFSQFVPMAAHAAPDAAIVLHMHCEWVAHFSESMLHRRLARIDSMLAVSERIAKQASERFPWLAERCHTLRNGVDIARFHPAQAAPGELPASRPLRLLYVGRISPEKGLHVLVEAVERLLAAGVDLELTVIGAQQFASPAEVAFDPEPLVRALAPLYDTDYEGSIRRSLSPRAADAISFAGFVSHDEMPKRYAAADAFVLPSAWHEPFCLSVVEAMAAGVPVIATAGGGQEEILEDGKSGLLVKRNDPASLADGIRKLEADPALRSSFGVGARQRALGFSWEANARWLLDHYGSLRTGRTLDVRAGQRAA